jgi:hypothetical protein
MFVRAWLLLATFLILSAPTTAMAQTACSSPDQLVQTRCQLERAIISDNLTLVETVFDKSAYADANDPEACGKHTYVQCVAAKGNLDALDILFKHGLNPNLRYYQDVSAFVVLLDGTNASEEYGARLMTTFLDHGVNLSVEMTHLRDGKNLKYFILSKCKQPWNIYPRYRGAIKTLISVESAKNGSPSAMSETLGDLDEIIADSRGNAVCQAVRTYAACGRASCEFPK